MIGELPTVAAISRVFTAGFRWGFRVGRLLVRAEAKALAPLARAASSTGVVLSLVQPSSVAVTLESASGVRLCPQVPS